MKDVSIFEMGLNEQIVLNAEGVADIMILRVPGGWIYTTLIMGSGMCTSKFIKFNDELDPVAIQERERRAGVI